MKTLIERLQDESANKVIAKPIEHTKETVIESAINELVKIKANLGEFNLLDYFHGQFNRYSATKSIYGLLTGHFKSNEAVNFEPKIYENLGLASNELGGSQSQNHTALEKVMSELPNDQNNAILAYIRDEKARPSNEIAKALLS